MRPESPMYEPGQEKSSKKKSFTLFHKKAIACLIMILALHSVNCSTLEGRPRITKIKCNVDAGLITINSSDNKSNNDKLVKTNRISGENYSAEYSAYNTGPDDEIKMFVIGTILHILYKGTNYTSTTSYNPPANVNFRLQVPNDCHIDINGGTTDVDLQNISGDITAETASGNITMHNIQGNLNLKTGSGTVYFCNNKNMTQQNHVTNYIIETGSGDITLHNPYAKKIIVSAGVGNIDIQNIIASKIRTRIGTGNITASYSSSSMQKSSFDFSTGTGNVNIQLPHFFKVMQQIKSKNLKSNFANNEKDPNLIIKGQAESGDIHIYSYK